jgi:hypothetical protein
MRVRTARIILLAAVFSLATAAVPFAQCGIANQVYCQPWDGTGNLVASQNDQSPGGFGNFATTYDNFTLTGTTDVESFHWVGGYFNPPSQGPIMSVTLTFYNDNAGTPGAPITTLTFSGTANETSLGTAGGFPIYSYSLDFGSVDMNAGTYWASIVPNINFPPEWGWAAGTGGDGKGYQCFFGSCGSTSTDFAFALDGTTPTPTPEPGTVLMMGTGILGLAGMLRRSGLQAGERYRTI